MISADLGADRAGVAAVVESGERDRVALTESLETWLETEEITPLSSI